MEPARGGGALTSQEYDEPPDREQEADGDDCGNDHLLVGSSAAVTGRVLSGGSGYRCATRLGGPRDLS